MGRWSFITNHADVLLQIAADPQARVRDLAQRVGITERSVQVIVNDLVEEGYVSRTRVGNRNRYQVHPERAMRRPIVHERQIGELLALIAGHSEPPEPSPSRPAEPGISA